jgi:putative transposase
MARPLRLELAGGLYHVTARGDRREAIYEDEDDRQAWLEVLAQVCERHLWRCHAWCQMTNHYHLVVETAEPNLSEGMRQLNGVYTQRYNRRHGKAGHVFQGRYHAVLVEKDAYLLELARYVVLNPVRAGMVADAAHWPWSSYTAMVGEEPAPRWLETDWLLGQFGSDRARAVASYVNHVRAGVGLPPVWNELRGQIYLGSEAFVAELQPRLEAAARVREVPRLQRRPMRQPLAAWQAIQPRARAMALAYRSGGYTMREIADFFGVHVATVSRAVRGAERSDNSTPPEGRP